MILENGFCRPEEITKLRDEIFKYPIIFHKENFIKSTKFNKSMTAARYLLECLKFPNTITANLNLELRLMKDLFDYSKSECKARIFDI